MHETAFLGTSDSASGDSASAFADSITIGLNPNDGSGDNFGFSSIQPGFVVGFGGGTPYGFFNDQGFASGSTFIGATPVFFSSGSVQFGDNTYDLSGGTGSLFLSNFTFPTNGQNFSILVQADFSASAYYFDNAGQYQTINIGGSAPGTMTFTWDVGRLRSVAFSPDGTRAAVGSDTGKVVVWDVDL